jgi:hypothetical protein
VQLPCRRHFRADFRRGPTAPEVVAATGGGLSFRTLPTFDANLSIDRQHAGAITPQHGIEFALVCRVSPGQAVRDRSATPFTSDRAKDLSSASDPQWRHLVRQ